MKLLSLTILYDECRKKKEAVAMEYKIIWVRGHVEVYDDAGRFFFSADNEREAREELRELAA